MIVKLAINILSGKLVCGNDFRDQYRTDRDDIDFDVNEKVGIKQTVEEYGRRGLLHGFVGNSCPSLFLDGNKLTIANLAYDKETDERIDDGSLGNNVWGICTDLWWYSVADYDDFIERGGEIDERWNTVVDVEPGRYVLSHDLDYPDQNWQDPVLYAVIERSDEEIVPWKMPEEGAAKAILELLPERFFVTKTVDVQPPDGADEDYIENYWKDRYDKHTIRSFLYVKSAWKRPDGAAKDDYSTPWEQVGFKIWGALYDGGERDHFIRDLVVSAEELQNYQVMADRVVTSFEESKEEELARNKLIKRREDMSEEEVKRLESLLKKARDKLLAGLDVR